MTDSCFSFKLPQLKSLSLRRGNSRTSLQQTSPDNPYCIVIDFSAVTEKECGKLDALNEKKYNKLIHKANKAEKSIHKTGLSMNLEVPPPPHPSNRDRFIIWKKRNVSRKVVPQSEAVVFLTKNNLILNEDYEAYQAIDLANEIKKEKGVRLHENDKTHNFDNVYNHHDKNILRRRSMYRANKFPGNDQVRQPPDYKNVINPQQQQPQPLPPPPIQGSASLRSASLRSSGMNRQIVLPDINSGQNQFYPQLPQNPEAPPQVQQPYDYNQFLPPTNAPSAPPITQNALGTPSKKASGNNVRFSVSCSTNDLDSDTSF
jgi:hypothetical protein